MPFKQIHSFFFLLSLILLFVTCSSKKTEREQYEDATSGLTYSTYKTTSRLVVSGAVKGYNLQAPDSLHLQPEYAHLLLGYFWSISGKSTIAFAEADIAEESNDGNVKFLAQSLGSITMYQKGWHDLAREQSAVAKQTLKSKPGTSVTYEATVFYLIMGTLYAKEKDFAQARFFWAGFGTETDIHWPYQICDAAADLQAGNIQKCLQKIKIITQDPAVPQPLREALAKEIAKIEQHAGTTVDSSLFWPRLVSNLIWEELQKSSDGALHNLMAMVNDLQEKISHK